VLFTNEVALSVKVADRRRTFLHLCAINQDHCVDGIKDFPSIMSAEPLGGTFKGGGRALSGSHPPEVLHRS